METLENSLKNYFNHTLYPNCQVTRALLTSNDQARFEFCIQVNDEISMNVYLHLPITTGESEAFLTTTCNFPKTFTSVQRMPIIQIADKIKTKPLTKKEIAYFQRELDEIKTRNKINSKEFIRTASGITSLTSFDRKNNQHNFGVLYKEIIEKGFSDRTFFGVEFEIFRPDKPLNSFYFKILFVEERILVAMVLNNYHTEVSEKGIIRAMVSKLVTEYRLPVMSSTNLDNKKLFESEGRIPDMTAAWKAWELKNSHISYAEDEDRYIHYPAIPVNFIDEKINN